MNKKILTFLTAGLMSAVSANAATIYLNFYDSTNGSVYTPSGTTWNNIDYGTGTSGETADYSGVSLNNSNATVTDSGIDFAFDVFNSNDTEYTGNGFSNAGADQASFDTPGTGSKFAWFDSSSSSLRETAAVAVDTYAVYTFSGFATSDDVTFEFAVGRSGTGTRRINLGVPADFTSRGANNGSLLDTVNTANVAHFASTGTLTGATSYTFWASRTDNDIDSDSASSLINAASISIIPEPSSIALVGLALGSLVLFRRRK